MLGLVVGRLLHDLAVDLVLEALELVAVAEHRQRTVHLVLVLQQLQVPHVSAQGMKGTVSRYCSSIFSLILLMDRRPVLYALQIAVDF